MRRLFLGALALVAARTATAQCTTQPNQDTFNGVAIVPRFLQPQQVGGTMMLSGFWLNVQDCGAVPTQSTDQTAALQAGISAACNATTLASGAAARPILFIPAGTYAYTTLTVPCNGLIIQGEGMSGGNPAGATQLCSTLGPTGTMLTMGTPTSAIFEAEVRDILFSGFCGTFPQGIDVNCNRCTFDHIQVTGFTGFGMRFQGKSSASTGGFNNISHSEFQSTQNNTFAFVIVSQASGGGPDGQAFTDNWINTSGTGGWIDDSTVSGATSLRSSQGFVGNRFNTTSSTVYTAVTGATDIDRFTSNRFENTGTGGIQVQLKNTVTTNLAAIFTGNIWACGPLLCTWVDSSSTPAVRQGEFYGPSTTTPAPGMRLIDGTATVSGAGSPVTLKQLAIAANMLRHNGDFLTMRAWGTSANNVNAKTVSVRFAGTNFISLPLTASAADQWYCEAFIAFTQSGANPQSVGGWCQQGSAVTTALPSVATLTFDPSVAQTWSIQAAQVSAGDVTQNGALVCYASNASTGGGGPGC